MQNIKRNIFLILFTLVSGLTNAQSSQQMIQGKLIDKKGNPIGGALISTIRNGDNAIVTGEGGDFIISATVGDNLYISGNQIGNKVYNVDKDKDLIIQLNFEDSKVNQGMGVVQKISQSTGAISVTYDDELDRRSEFNLANSLYGNALGLTSLQNSGNVWENNPDMFIRGLQTTSNNQILVLVDGFERDIMYITPSEVESVCVLRDAAAVAIYGYKGVNGVLLVTTKRGKYNTNEISASYDHGFNTQRRLPDFADSYTYASAINEALSNDGEDLRYNEYELNAFKDGSLPYLYANTDWFDEVLREQGHSNIYNVNFRGGGKKIRYYTMFNLQSDQGFMDNTEMNDGYSTQDQYSRANIRTNLDIDIGPTTKATVNLSGVLQEFSIPAVKGDNLFGVMYKTPSAAFPIQTEDGVWGGSEIWGNKMNPVALTQARGYTLGHTRSLFADFSLTQELNFITKGLSVTGQIAYDNTVAYWDRHTRDYAYANDVVTSWSADGEPLAVSRYSGGADSELGFTPFIYSENRHSNVVLHLDYDRTFNKHSIYGSMIYSQDSHIWNGQNNTYNRANVALYARYNYDNRYTFDLTMGTSASNRLAPSSRWNFSPTIGASWNISNEDFMSSVSWIDFLKLRGSFGIINSDNIPENAYWVQSYSAGGGYSIGGNYNWYGGYSEDRLASENSTVEKAYKYNLGIDGRMFSGLDFTLDGFYESRKDIWVGSGGRVSDVLGVTPSYINGGIVNSKGVEIGANYLESFNNDWKIGLGVKYTLSKNKISEMYEQPRPEEYMERTGKPVNQIFGYEALGFFEDQEDIDSSPTQQFSEVKPGDIKYKDQNADNIINENDQLAMGYNQSVPEQYYSFNINIEWKGFGIYALFQGVGNYSTMLTTPSLYRPLANNTTISNHYYENRWTPDNQQALYPRLTTESNANNLKTSNVWLADASFLKLRNCEVFYNLPDNLLKKMRMTNAKIYVRGVDLLCFDSIDIASPEAMGAVRPLTKSVHLGFTFGF